MERRVCNAFCFGCGSARTVSSSTLPSLLLSVTSEEKERKICNELGMSCGGKV